MINPEEVHRRCGGYWFVWPDTDDIATIRQFVGEAHLQVHVQQTFPLGQLRGRLVLEP